MQTLHEKGEGLKSWLARALLGALLLAAAGVGCASAPTKQWNQPGAGATDFYADRAYCQQQAQVQYGADAGLNLLTYLFARGGFDRCM